MPRICLLLSTGLLLSCALAPLDTGDVVAPGAALLPAEASVSWLEAVQARIAASARSIVPEGETFTAALPAHSAVARFTAEGLVLGELNAEQPLHLRFSTWGAASAEREVEPVAPALGDCVTDVLPEGDCARRLEYAHEGVTAWWVGLDGGVEFGWTVAAPPADVENALIFRTEVDGADWVAAEGDGAELVDAAGVTWTVSGALAWGADGAPLPAWLEVDGDALVVQVDAEGAAYPVTVDPVLSAATTTLTGAGAYDSFGNAVSGAGDVNGDGYGDVIVGVSYYAGSYANVGRALVYHGSSSGLSSSASRTLPGGASGHYFGYSVSGAGDVNGDGYDDVIIGAMGYDTTGLGNRGAAYIYHGSASGVSATVGTMLTGGGDDDYFGVSVSGAGDVNGDGYDDVIVGAYGYASFTGRAYVNLGSASGVLARANVILTGGAVDDQFGDSVSGAGDVNGDGYDDVIIGASMHDVGSLNAVGKVVIHHGSASGVSSSASLTLTGGAAVDRLGHSVSAAGDVNGDGYDDVIIGAYGHAGFIGRTYVHHGSASGLGITPSLILPGAATSDYFGASVSGAGDVNDDGYDDVIIGASGYTHFTNRFTGAVYIHHGSSTGVSSTSSRMLVGNDASVFFGSGVSDAGDVNGDGYDDVLVGAPGYDLATATNAGAVFVHQGYADEDGDGMYLGGDSTTMQDCDDDDATVGAPSTRYVDADGDGFGGTATVTACAGAPGTAATATDCDDARADVNPSATEVCDTANADEDCDGLADDADPTVDAAGFSAFYADADADGFGNAAAATSTCDLPAAHVTDNTDCDDSRADVYPAAADAPADGVDQNCDGRGADGLEEAPAKAGCATAPEAPVTWLASLLALPALVLRRRRV